MDEAGNDRKHQQAFIRAYIFCKWQSIEAKRQSGGWPEILRDFREFLPEGTEINEETFRKVLQRAGFSDVGREGRPPKTRTKIGPHVLVVRQRGP